MTWNWTLEAVAAMSKRMTSPFWRENDAKLRALVEGGASTKQAAESLGVSKNTVIGRARRIGVDWLGSSIWTAPAAPLKPPITFPNPGRCLWPHGHPGEDGFHFCGEHAEAGRPYCGEHHATAYRPQVYRSADEAAAERAVAWAVTRSAT